MNEAGIHLFIGFQGVSLEDELKYLIRDYRPGGIVLFKRNIESREQLKNLVADARSFALEELKRPVFFAIDQEGGSVQRLAPHFNSIPAASSLVEQGPEAVSKWSAVCAADLREIGIQINFAPVLDIVAEGINTFHGVPLIWFDSGKSIGPRNRLDRNSAGERNFRNRKAFSRTWTCRTGPAPLCPCHIR